MRFDVFTHCRAESERLRERYVPTRGRRVVTEAAVTAREERAHEAVADEEQLRSRRSEVGALEEPQVIDRVVVIDAEAAADNGATVAGDVPRKPTRGAMLFVSFGLAAVPLPKSGATIVGRGV